MPKFMEVDVEKLVLNSEGSLQTSTVLVRSIGLPIDTTTMLIDASLWHLGASLAGFDWASAGTVVNSGMLWQLDLPDGATLIEFGCKITSPGSHGPSWPSNAPQNMPTITVYKKSLTGASSTVATQTDSNASKAAYEAQHTLEKTGVSEVIDNATTSYYLVVTNESGSNAASGVIVGKPWCTVTQTEFRP
jgi:hypothetical protein